MAQQKLYTEEQVHKIIELAEFGRHITYGELLDEFTPIEIPSDEEIVQHSKEEPDNFDIKTSSRLGKYVAGAIWMRDKIQGGNK